jgi:hypothetical protein
VQCEGERAVGFAALAARSWGPGVEPEPERQPEAEAKGTSRAVKPLRIPSRAERTDSNRPPFGPGPTSPKSSGNGRTESLPFIACCRRDCPCACACSGVGCLRPCMGTTTNSFVLNAECFPRPVDQYICVQHNRCLNGENADRRFTMHRTPVARIEERERSTRKKRKHPWNPDRHAPSIRLSSEPRRVEVGWAEWVQDPGCTEGGGNCDAGMGLCRLRDHMTAGPLGVF